MGHLNTAYQLGAHDAYTMFIKHAEGEQNLGDPNYWTGGTPPPEEAGMPGAGGGAEGGAPPTAEDTIGLLPAGTFQGLQSKITPDGQKTVSMKVSPDALSAPDALAAIFQTGENAKIEIASPDLSASATGYSESRGSDIPLPGEEVPPQPGGMPPAPGEGEVAPGGAPPPSAPPMG